MNLVRIIEWLRQRLTAVVRICLVALAVLVLVDAIPGVVDKEHAHTALERWPGFWALFGFLGCVMLILVSKWFGHCGIMKDEDYYDD
jgi:succinate dehydrogenase hydrophobic anchor subunit